MSFSHFPKILLFVISMSKFISCDLLPSGILSTRPTQIIAKIYKSSNQVQQEQFDRVVQHFSKKQQRLLNKNQTIVVMDKCKKLRSKLYRYAKSVQFETSKTLDAVRVTNLNDRVQRIHVEKRYQSPISNKLDYLKDMMDTYLFKEYSLSLNNQKLKNMRLKETISHLGRTLKNETGKML